MTEAEIREAAVKKLIEFIKENAEDLQGAVLLIDTAKNVRMARANVTNVETLGILELAKHMVLRPDTEYDNAPRGDLS